MTSLANRVTFGPDGPVVGRSQVPVSSIIERLEQGESWAAAVSELALEPLDVVAALALDALGDEGSLGLPLIQGDPPRPALSSALNEPAIRAVAPDSDRGTRLALAAGLLQIYDFWDASHHAAQAADDLGERAFSSYWHAIAHRREPDPGNAAYWFRRVGQHPLLTTLWQAAQPIFATEENSVTLSRAGRWDSMAFVDMCARVQPGSKEEALARRFQRIEMLTLLDANSQAMGLVN